MAETSGWPGYRFPTNPPHSAFSGNRLKRSDYLRRSSLNCAWWQQYSHERPQSDDADGGRSRTKPPGQIRNAPDGNVKRTRPEMNDRHASVAIRMPGVNRCYIILTARSCQICPTSRNKLTAHRWGPPGAVVRCTKLRSMCRTEGGWKPPAVRSRQFLLGHFRRLRRRSGRFAPRQLTLGDFAAPPRFDSNRSPSQPFTLAPLSPKLVLGERGRAAFKSLISRSLASPVEVDHSFHISVCGLFTPAMLL